MLVILGEKDYFMKFSGVEDFIKSGTVNHFASNLEIEYVPEGSHFAQEQFHDKISSLILAFLKWWSSIEGKSCETSTEADVAFLSWHL
ncbi:hypothetical protein CTI12_AA229830 [Artemisia annua]|uniref:Epoxide hydrolase n=1 Tax=Artemisia annua TaxID=35608 RepID=A0A2U1NTE3_ARTAN|nr:hypothetical protein CTI12_AA229830 [Artemisia annua]